MTSLRIARVEHAEIVFEPRPWPFARDQHEAIARHFDQRRRERSGIWNGRVLMLHRYVVEANGFHGACFETDYASFLAWRDWRFPDMTVSNYFSAAALRGSDGAFVLGEMAPQTSSAGLIYFPSGMPEPADLVDSRADLVGSVARELAEETGIDIAECDVDPRWSVVIDGAFVALIKLVQARAPAEVLCERIRQNLAREPAPEFAALHIVRSAADYHARMPAFVTAFLDAAWGEGL